MGHGNFSSQNCEDVEDTKLCFINWHLHELEGSWDDNTCKVIPKKRH